MLTAKDDDFQYVTDTSEYLSLPEAVMSVKPIESVEYGISENDSSISNSIITLYFKIMSINSLKLDNDTKITKTITNFKIHFRLDF